MSTTARMRDAAVRARHVRRAVVDPDELEALCDIADAARDYRRVVAVGDSTGETWRRLDHALARFHELATP